MGIFDYRRRKARVVNIGGIPLGGDCPIRLQSMTSTSTMDAVNSVEQIKRICAAGASYVRLTAQGVREAENIGVIGEELRRQGVNVPLVADIHFNPRAAHAAAKVVEKVRINPGNFVDPGRTFRQLSYTDEEYASEIKKIEEAFVPFLELCRSHGTAIRIGVNHGSLSDRIMSRYGDTPAGMVESAMEFLRVCVAHDFMDVVISIKASNTVIMVETVRRLVKAMAVEGMDFPLHLGVTEAGDGEDGRVKSAVGIGTLLCEGVGDTIRVSLSEEPECEIPVAQALVDYISKRANSPELSGIAVDGYCHEAPERLVSAEVGNIGGTHPPVVIITGYADGVSADYCYFHDGKVAGGIDLSKAIVPRGYWDAGDATLPLYDYNERNLIDTDSASLKFLKIDAATPVEEYAPLLAGHPETVVVLYSSHLNIPGALQAATHALKRASIKNPVIPHSVYGGLSEDVTIEVSADFGAMLLNGMRDGIWIDAEAMASENVDRLSFGILQAARLRITRTEFISCPGCGRTLFDLQSAVKAVKEATGHLKGLKIGIMGCIVNGPGEMADADYGYVGAAAGHVSLYKGKTCVEKNIPEKDAIAKLIELIKTSGDWQEKDNG